MESLLIFIVELFFEFLIQGFFELVVGSSVRRVRPSTREKTKLPAFLSYGAIAIATGWLSVELVPALYIKNPKLQIANLLIGPFIIAFAISFRTKVIKKDEDFIKLDKFSYAYLFALLFSLTRYALAHKQ